MRLRESSTSFPHYKLDRNNTPSLIQNSNVNEYPSVKYVYSVTLIFRVPQDVENEHRTRLLARMRRNNGRERLQLTRLAGWERWRRRRFFEIELQSNAHNQEGSIPDDL